MIKLNSTKEAKYIEKKSQLKQTIKLIEKASENQDLVVHLTIFLRLDWESTPFEKKANAIYTRFDE